MSAAPKDKKIKVGGNARSAARLAAVQALFQCDRSGDSAHKAVREFIQQRLDEEVDGFLLAHADQDFFADVVEGAYDRRESLDAEIEKYLNKDWRIDRMDPLLLQILRAGAYELAARPDVPTAAVINEYINVTHAFYDEAEAKFVNGLLDKLAKALGR